MLETGLENIKKAGIEKEDENYSFRELLKTFPQADLDLWFGELSREISPRIDCLACGNCCRTYMISINQAEAERIAGRLGMGLSDFEKKYTETGLSGMQVFNRIPCHFLCSGNACSIYPDRPSDCSSFPHLEKPGIQQRLFSTFEYYGICPIVYNVIEGLKNKLTAPLINNE